MLIRLFPCRVIFDMKEIKRDLQKILEGKIGSGKAKTVYSADYFEIVYSDIQFLIIFVYWTIQFNFMMYNIDI